MSTTILERNRSNVELRNQYAKLVKSYPRDQVYLDFIDAALTRDLEVQEMKKGIFIVRSPHGTPYTVAPRTGSVRLHSPKAHWHTVSDVARWLDETVAPDRYADRLIRPNRLAPAIPESHGSPTSYRVDPERRWWVEEARVDADTARRIFSLDAFQKQRSVAHRRVKLAQSALLQGTYFPDANIIIGYVGDTLYLLNGQHRLKAIINTGVEIDHPFLVVRANDVSELQEIYSNLDQGKARTKTDAITAIGANETIGLSRSRANKAGAALRTLIVKFHNSKMPNADNMGAIANNAIAHATLRWEHEIKSYLDAVDRSDDRDVRNLMQRAPVMACGLVTYAHEPRSAEAFWTGLAEDDGLGKHDPRKRLLRWLIKGQDLRSETVVKAFSEAWSAFLHGRKMRNVDQTQQEAVYIENVPLDQIAADLADVPTHATPAADAV